MIGLSLLIVVLVSLDQVVKWWTVQNIALNEVVDFLPGIVNLAYLRNYGAAYSILQHQQAFFIVLTVFVLGGAIWYLVRHLQDSLWLLASLSLVIAGGLGNFIDRVRLGYVVDMFYLDMIEFPVFNVADAYLTVGVVLLFIIMLKEEKNGHH